MWGGRDPFDDPFFTGRPERSRDRGDRRDDRLFKVIEHPGYAMLLFHAVPRGHRRRAGEGIDVASGAERAPGARDQQRADTVIIAASASGNSQPMQLAVDLARLGGKIVVVGDVGMDVPRNEAYTKELEVRLSMSYGPGRYDATYEERGQDYPYAHVRYTEQRNLQSFLEAVEDGRVDLQPLLTEVGQFCADEIGKLDARYREDIDALSVKVARIDKTIETTPSNNHTARPAATGTAAAIAPENLSRIVSNCDSFFPNASVATKSRASLNSSLSPTIHSVSSESTKVTAMSKPLPTARPLTGATESRPNAPGQHKGDSTSLQRECSARARSGKSIHASRPFREMIARPKISRNEWKTAEIGAFEVGNFALFCCPVRERVRVHERVRLVPRPQPQHRRHVLRAEAPRLLEALARERARFAAALERALAQVEFAKKGTQRTRHLNNVVQLKLEGLRFYSGTVIKTPELTVCTLLNCFFLFVK